MSEMQGWRLTRNQQIAVSDALPPRATSSEKDGVLCDTQARRLIKWGLERCDNTDHWPYFDTVHADNKPIRFGCHECQVQLRKDVGL